MASVNKAILIGTLGRDPEIKYMPNGNAVASLSLATSERWKDKASGEQKEETTWHRIVAYGKLAEIMGQYLKKGANVYIEGRIKQRSYEKDGEKRYVTEILADQMTMLDKAGAKEDKPKTGVDDDGAPF